MRYLGYFLYWLLFYFLIVYSRPFYLMFIVKNFSKIRYNDDLTDGLDAANHMVLMAYVVVSLYWNKKTLAAIGSSTRLMWVINGAIDYLLLPLGVLIMVLYNNTKITLTNLSSVENMALMFALIGIKHIVIYFKTGLLIIGHKQK